MTFLVNPAGYVHDVEDDTADALLDSGFRVATSDEVANWYSTQGLKPPASAKPAAKAKTAKAGD